MITAEREGKAIVPFTDEHPDLDLEVAYDAADQFVAAPVAGGERVIGG